jgi:YjbE family integral membrane protein
MPAFDMDFISAFLSIILIDLVLAGDNAVVIALAVCNLPKKQRTLGIAFGAGAAVILRVGLTAFAATLMDLPAVKLIGGLLIAWIGVKLFVEGSPDDKDRRECTSISQAVVTIIVADLVMSTDNILAVAGASHGNFWLLIFGLGLSIPFVVFTSSLLSKLMDRYPWIIALGAAVLGKVAVEMVLTDPVSMRFIALDKPLFIIAEIVGAVGVVAVGKLWLHLTPALPAGQGEDETQAVIEPDRPASDR